jgi:RNA polymerase sigma-70 factor, ECF subfamily
MAQILESKPILCRQVKMTHYDLNSRPRPLDTSSVSLLDGTAEINGSRRLANAVPESITVLLSRVSGGNREAFDQLIPLVYHELHRMAEGYVRRESQNYTLQATALIHEAYVRLVESSAAGFQNRAHFFGAASRVMRQILVDHARARQAVKRGPGLKVAFEQHFDFAPEQDRVVTALDDALNELAREDSRKARLVEMRFFGGMTAEEIADSEGSPVHLIRRELRAAQAWLRREMET